MVNTINEFQERNKQLLEENENLKKQLADKEKENEQNKTPLQFKPLNNEEIRAWIITDVLSRDYSASDIDNKAIDIIMGVYVDQENWSSFCKNYPTEPVRKAYILTAYKFNHYYNLTRNLYNVRDDARRKIFINLIKLNSEESKELFRKWLNEGKIKESDVLTTERIIEKGYEKDQISQICYDYFDIRHFSLEELINSWKELTVSVNKKLAKINELEKVVEELKVKLEEQDNEIEVLNDRVEAEQEMAMKSIDKAEEWRERQLKEKTAGYIANERNLLDRIKVLENNVYWLENKEQIIKKYEEKELPALPKKQKKSKLLKLKKLVSKVKEKTQEKFQTFIVQKNK